MNLIPKGFFLDNFFDDFSPYCVNMRTDIYEKDNMYFLEIDIPGFDKKDINIEYKNGYLNISIFKESIEEENKNYYRQERCVGKFDRSFYLGDIDEDSINATVKDGVLIISVSKKDTIENKKIIEIN